MSDECPRCGTSLGPLDWRVTHVTTDGEFVDVCEDCDDQLPDGLVDPKDLERKEIATDGGTDADDAERGIYLAGPVEHDDTPRSWRDELRDRYPEINWIDPMDWQDEWEDDPAVVWDRELETCRTGAVLVCNIGSHAPRTTGTEHDIGPTIDCDNCGSENLSDQVICAVCGQEVRDV